MDFDAPIDRRQSDSFKWRTYGADVLHGAVHGAHSLHFGLDFAVLGAFCVGLFAASLMNIKRKWIL